MAHANSEDPDQTAHAQSGLDFRCSPDTICNVQILHESTMDNLFRQARLDSLIPGFTD